MIFEVKPSQINGLQSQELVELLKKLLHAEAQRCDIPLSGVSVPLQICVPDGGEDGRIEWEGGVEGTHYLPSRFCIFQAKATDLGPADWKKEVWTKASQKKGVTRKLNEAVKKVIDNNGCYIGFTSDSLVTDKRDERIESIKTGIQEAGSDTDKLKIDIYDANKIASWIEQYPAIAVWINEKRSGLNLKGYQTIEALSKKPNIASIQLVPDQANRFLIVKENQDNPFEKAKERIIGELADAKKSIYIFGSSGVGKTRFVYEVLRDETTVEKIALATSAIYCDFNAIGNSNIIQTVQSLAEKPALIIVDECPRETAIKLVEIVNREGSNLRIITIGNDNKPIEQENCLNILVKPADDALIEGIIRQRYPKASYSDIDFIKKNCDRYPRIAVLATDNYSEGLPILQSVEDFVERILRGCGITRIEQVRAIECLCLFGMLGADKDVSNELNFVAENLARQTGDEMYEHLAYAAKQKLLDHYGCYFELRLIPIVAFLGARRLDLLRVNTIRNFIESAPPNLRRSFLEQWRYFDTSKTLARVAQALLHEYRSLEKLKSEIGSELLKAIVHIDPNGVTEVIRYTYGNLSIDDLKEALTRKEDFVEVLAILASRKLSFGVAAPLLMRLAAINNDKGYFYSANNRFNQLFQLHLSETEAEPSDRCAVIEQGVLSGDERVILVCIEALGNTLKSSYLSGTGIYNQIGNRPPLKEWSPKIWDEVFNFHRKGLKKLINIRANHEQFAEKCEKIIASHIRSLLCVNLLDDLENIMKDISKEKGIWLEAIKAMGDWLYFDRIKIKAPEAEDFAKKVRKLYDDLIPTDPIQQALLYTKFWSSHLQNPDLSYERDDKSTKDFEYSSRKAKEIAAEIALDNELTYRAIQTMVIEELNNVFPFAHELAMRLENPIEAFQVAVEEFEKSTNIKGVQFLCGLLAGIDKRSAEYLKQCIDIALQSDALKDQMVDIYRAVNISVERLNEIVEGVKEGKIRARSCVCFSYGRGLDSLSAEEILPLIDELAFNQGIEGMWASIEIISMYRSNKDNLDEKIAERIKMITTSQMVFDASYEFYLETHSIIDHEYVLGEIISLVQTYYGIDDNFAIGLSNQIIQIIKLCQSEYYSISRYFNNFSNSIIEILAKEKPYLLWQTLWNFLEGATPLEANQLEEFIRPLKQKNLLLGISEQEYIEWAKNNPAIRSPLLFIFYPIVETTEMGDIGWHPALEKLTHEFGALSEFREALENQFYDLVWCGSDMISLEKYLKPLETWFEHPVSEMSSWARDIYYSLKRQIERQYSSVKENY